MSGPPSQLGPYRLLRRLGAGGMGEVWLAEHAALGVQRALKLLPPTQDLELLARFQREAEAMAQLDHPHVARVHERGQEHGHAYLVLDLLPGGDLEERLRKGPLPVGEVVSLTAQLAAGLAHIHAHGLLHRDIKPANVLFDEHGQPRWVDFGLVRAAGSSSLTETGAVLGTPAYMAPEQALGLGQELDPRADVYGLGALLYHCLTGAPPFGGSSLIATLQQVVEEAPRAPSQLRPELSPAIDAVCLRALAKDPAARFATALELADALRRASAAPARRPRAAWALLGLALALGALALWAWPEDLRPLPAAPKPHPKSSGAKTPTDEPATPLPRAERPPRSRISLLGQPHSAVAFTPAGELRILTRLGLLDGEDVDTPLRELDPPERHPDCLGFGGGLTWAGGDQGYLLRGQRVTPLAGFMDFALSPSGEEVLIPVTGGCARLDLRDPGAELAPWVDAPGGQWVQAIAWVEGLVLISWGGYPDDAVNNAPKTLRLYDTSGTLLGEQSADNVAQGLVGVAPGTFVCGSVFGGLFQVSWDGLTLKIEPWGGEAPSIGESPLASHLPTRVGALAVAGPEDARILYGVSNGERKQLRAWSWTTGERLADFQLDCETRNLAISPRGDWLALGTKGSCVYLLRLSNGAPDWER